MTTRTGYLFMLSVQPECRAVMIELSNFPVCRFMTPLAIGLPFLRELPCMRIKVTASAVLLHSLELLNRHSMLIFPEMTFPASYSRMRACQRIRGSGMIEGNHIPSFIAMALSAVRLRIILLVQIRCMNILVAICTPAPDLTETPF